MNPVLTPEQIQAIQANHDGPVRVINPQNNEPFVIVRAEVFDEMQSILKEDYQLSDTYVAQMQSAMRAGWDDPAMDVCNELDPRRAQ